MEIYQLKSFATVAEEGNLTRAAERLFTSQPAVSAHIKALEEEMGVRLFDRATRGMSLTLDGEKLLEIAERVLAEVKQLNERARELQANPAGALRIGVLLDGDTLPLDVISRALLASHPGLQLEFVHSSSGTIVKGLLNGDLDIGFAEGVIDSPLLEATKVGETTAVVVASPTYKSVFASALWSDLQALPWVFKTPECSFHQLMERICQAHGLSLNRRYIIDHEATCLQFVRNGNAVSIVNERAVRDHLEQGSLIVWDAFRGILDINLICLSQRVQERAIAAFLSAAKPALGIA